MSTSKQREQASSTETRRSQWVLLAVTVLAAVIALSLFAGTLGGDGGESNDSPPDEAGSSASAPASASPSTAETGQGGAAGTDFEAIEQGRREEGDPKALGEVDAPVMMVAYSEFQCPFCGRFARQTMPDLEPYIQDGTLRVEWRDLPYLGPESTLAALGGEAAAEQGKFWEFHDAIYADQPEVNSGTVTEDWMTSLATELGMDADAFRASLSSTETLEAVQADKAEGVAIGATGTPAFLINGEPVMGAQPTATFVEVIESAAAEAQP